MIQASESLQPGVTGKPCPPLCHRHNTPVIVEDSLDSLDLSNIPGIIGQPPALDMLELNKHLEHITHFREECKERLGLEHGCGISHLQRFLGGQLSQNPQPVTWVPESTEREVEDIVAALSIYKNAQDAWEADRWNTETHKTLQECTDTMQFILKHWGKISVTSRRLLRLFLKTWIVDDYELRQSNGAELEDSVVLSNVSGTGKQAPALDVLELNECLERIAHFREECAKRFSFKPACCISHLLQSEVGRLPQKPRPAMVWRPGSKEREMEGVVAALSVYKFARDKWEADRWNIEEYERLQERTDDAQFVLDHWAELSDTSRCIIGLFLETWVTDDWQSRWVELEPLWHGAPRT